MPPGLFPGGWEIKRNWINTYGTQGYEVIRDATSLPSYATVTPSGELPYTWTNSTTDPRALQDASGTGRIAAAWYASTSFTVDVNLTDGQTHDLELYFLDWDTTARSETVQLSNATTGAVLDTETISSFHSGVYLDWAVSGNVLITITRIGSFNPVVLSGLFLDPVAASTPTITWAAPANIVYGTALSSTQLDATASVAWHVHLHAGRRYGSQGRQRSDAVGNLHSHEHHRVQPRLDDRADQRDAGNADDQLDQPRRHHRRHPAVECAARCDLVVDRGGVSGSVAGTFTYTPALGTVLSVGNNQTLSVTFTPTDTTDFTPVTATVTINVIPLVTSATFLGQDTTTQGNWINTYGTQGYEVIGNATSLPSYATVTPSGQLPYTWTNNTTDPRALQDAGGTGRIAAAWYASTSFTVDVNLTDGQTHDLELYFLDWDTTARSETVS